MAWEEIISNGIEGDYWIPNTKGQQIEGNIVEFLEDQYEKTQVLLELENEEQITLPGHADLQNKYNKLSEGDYIRITLRDIKKSKNPEYADKNIYKVEVDPDRKVEYETQEEL